jgi:subtilisin family serine protease
VDRRALPRSARAALAAASGAREADRVLGIWTAPAPVAHRLAATLRAKGLLRVEEPDPPRRAHPARDGRCRLARRRVGGLVEEHDHRDGGGGAGRAGPAAAPVAVIEDGFDPAIPDIPPSVVLRRPSPAPETAHGTAVVSVIAGRGPRVLGVNPGSDVRVYGSTGFCSDTARAIRQAVGDGAKVVNMSYGDPAGERPPRRQPSPR